MKFLFKILFFLFAIINVSMSDLTPVIKRKWYKNYNFLIRFIFFLIEKESTWNLSKNSNLFFIMTMIQMMYLLMTSNVRTKSLSSHYLTLNFLILILILFFIRKDNLVVLFVNASEKVFMFKHEHARSCTVLNACNVNETYLMYIYV